MSLNFTQTIPLSLYIHIPWCVRKCPYCDFNSHQADDKPPFDAYVDALIADLDASLPLIYGRRLISIFIGGGTPSLMPGEAISRLLQAIHARFHYGPSIEITMEANPGTVDEQHFAAYRQVGVNRLSLGIQSFNDQALKRLGRIHDGQAAQRALQIARTAGFDNINIDIMFGLPKQTHSQALADLQQAIALQPEHLSWYQLTIEPNTVFHAKPPSLPVDDDIAHMQDAGWTLLQQVGFSQYEVSAYAKPAHQCQHNLNYWQFGDYLGIGAGAHSKITDVAQGVVRRYRRATMPRTYLSPDKPFIAQTTEVSEQDIVFEFMLNALRLQDPIPLSLFEQRTGLNAAHIQSILDQARQAGFIRYHTDYIEKTEFGQRFLNDLQALFLETDNKV